MKSQQLAATIGLILFSASIAIPVKGHSADLKSLLGNVITNAAKDKISSSTASKTPQPKASHSNATASETALIQAELNRRNYAAGAVDGKAGPKTTAAIKRCQLDNGWEPTGILTAAQRDHLLGSGNVGSWCCFWRSGTAPSQSRYRSCDRHKSVAGERWFEFDRSEPNSNLRQPGFDHWFRGFGFWSKSDLDRTFGHIVGTK